MMRTCLALILTAGAATSAAQAQDYTFELVQTEDISLLSDLTNPTFFIGNNPSSIAFNGTDLFVGGFANFSDPIPGVQIVQIQDFLLGPGGRTFSLVEGSFSATPNPVGQFRGWSGLDWDDERGLLGTIDFNNQTGNQIRVFNYKLSTQGGVLSTLDQKARSIDLRGQAGPSWDRGFNGEGFGSDGGIVAAHMDSSLGNFFERIGPFGHILPDEPGLGDPIPDLDSFDVAYFPSESGTTGPVMAQESTSTLWRDLDINPNTGDMAARAANILIIGTRGSDGLISSRVSVGADNAPFVSGQNVAFIHGLAGDGDLIVYNDRPTTAGGQAFTNVVKFAQTDGTPVTYSVVDSAGNPVGLPSGVGYYDFAWHEESQTLCIVDFANRSVYVLRQFDGSACECDSPANLNCDDTVNVFDLFAYLQNYNAGDPSADLAEPFDTINVFDLFEYLRLYGLGCP